jgi:hypothetical protein
VERCEKDFGRDMWKKTLSKEGREAGAMDNFSGRLTWREGGAWWMVCG